MTQPSHEPTDQPTANMPRVSLDDFIEAVTLGVRRAMEAENDVAGYAFQPGGQTLSPNLIARPPIIVGIVYNPPNHLDIAAQPGAQNVRDEAAPGRGHADVPLCPSAQPEMEGAVVSGVIQGTAREPRLAHLVQPLPVTDDVLSMTGKVSPTAVFRFAAPCAASACVHFAENRCRLASRVVETLPEAVDGLPPCRIRPTCRWWRQEGKAACLRCPMIVTETANPTELLLTAADPAAYSAGD